MLFTLLCIDDYIVWGMLPASLFLMRVENRLTQTPRLEQRVAQQYRIPHTLHDFGQCDAQLVWSDISKADGKQTLLTIIASCINKHETAAKWSSSLISY